MDIKPGLFLSEYSSESSIHEKCVTGFQMLTRGYAKLPCIQFVG